MELDTKHDRETAEETRFWELLWESIVLGMAEEGILSQRQYDCIRTHWQEKRRKPTGRKRTLPKFPK